MYVLLLFSIVIVKVSAVSNWAQVKVPLVDHNVDLYVRGTITHSASNIYASVPNTACTSTISNCGVITVLNRATQATVSTIRPTFNFPNQFLGEKLSANDIGLLATGQYVQYTPENAATSKWMMTIYNRYSMYFMKEVSGILVDIGINNNNVIALTMQQVGYREVIMFAESLGSWTEIDRIQFAYDDLFTKLTDDYIIITHGATANIFRLDSLGHILRNQHSTIILPSSIDSVDCIDETNVYVGVTDTPYTSNTTLGAVHVIQRSNTQWALLSTKLWHPSGFSPSTFGYSISLFGKYLAVGAYGEPLTNNTNNPGGIFLYEWINNVFVLRDQVFSANPEHGSYFGYDFKVIDSIIYAKKNALDNGNLYVLKFDVRSFNTASYAVGAFLSILMMITVVVLYANRKYIDRKFREYYQNI